MLYSASKVFWFLAQPSSLICLMIVVGLARTRLQSQVRAGVRQAWLGLVLLLIAGLSPVSTLLILPLEQRFPQLVVADGARDWSGIIVLGGAEDGRVSKARGQLHLNEAAERVTEGARLARRLPGTRIVFTGGASLLLMQDVAGAGPVAVFWQAMGIARDRIVLEDRSRNTYENAAMTRAILAPKAGERWLLVTSAAHMPRAMGVFRHAGFDVTAYPVDYRTRSWVDGGDAFGSLPAGLKRLDDAAKEWVGLVAYRLAGRTGSLFPEP